MSVVKFPGFPESVVKIIEDFVSLEVKERLELLLEFSESLPELPERLLRHPQLLEPVPECQSPLFLRVEKYGDDTVGLFFSAPPEAPTTRGFAAILYESLNGLSCQEILDIPSDMVYEFGLEEAVTPLRLRGMSAMLMRVKNQLLDL